MGFSLEVEAPKALPRWHREREKSEPPAWQRRLVFSAAIFMALFVVGADVGLVSSGLGASSAAIGSGDDAGPLSLLRWRWWRRVLPGSESARTKRVKVRLLWTRHGQSCSNVMYRCPKEPDQGLLDEISTLLFQDIPGEEHARLDAEFGIQGPSNITRDCSVQIAGTSRVPGVRGPTGAVVRMHDLIRDPPLTDCSLKHSELAGLAFIRWLRDSNIRLDFLGSSFLMRAFETAVAMFLEPCFDGKVNCTGAVDDDLRVTQIPYTEEKPLPGRTSVSADCLPRPAEEQSDLMRKIFGGQQSLHIDTAFGAKWPRHTQHFEKFKAFLATQVVPALPRVGLPWALAPAELFREALERALPREMVRADHGKKVAFSWVGGSYETGASFSKEEYRELDAPEVNLAIVGHAAMMMEYCLEGEYTPPDNNAVLEKLFILEATPSVAMGDVQTAEVVFREASGRCPMIMTALKERAVLESLVAEDLGSCEHTFPVSELLQIPDGGLRPGDHTTCEKLAEDPGSFAIQPEFQVNGIKS